MNTDYYWHFCQVDEFGTPRLGYGDYREIKVGETLRVEGEPVLWRHGLHAQDPLLSALRNASGSKLALCRVTLGGTILDGGDTFVATERTAIAMLDADATAKLVRDWARWCAFQVIHLWGAPDFVRQYLETGDESMQAAAHSVAAAGSETTVRAVQHAQRAAAWATAEDEIFDMAWATALDAATAILPSAMNAAIWVGTPVAVPNAAASWAWVAARDENLSAYAAELERRALAAMGIEN